MSSHEQIDNQNEAHEPHDDDHEVPAADAHVNPDSGLNSPEDKARIAKAKGELHSSSSSENAKNKESASKNSKKGSTSTSLSTKAKNLMKDTKTVAAVGGVGLGALLLNKFGEFFDISDLFGGGGGGGHSKKSGGHGGGHGH